jgi:HEAT repeat protein
MEPLSPPPGLTDPDYRVRLQTIYALVEDGQPQVVRWIRPLLRDRESPVRNAAIVALGDLLDQGAFDGLLACMSAHMSLERRNVVQALVTLNNPRMREPLTQALNVEPAPSVRRTIVKALSTFRQDGEVIDAVISTLTDPDEDVRATAAVALAKMGDSRALPALQRMAQTDTNAETTINGLWELNSSIAQKAIKMIRSPEEVSSLDWPD